MVGYIYQITNNINGKIYIGFATDVKRRWRAHCHRALRLNSQLPLYRAIRKHGVDKFELAVLYTCRNAKYCLDVMEPYFIGILHSNNKEFGYNLAEGGRGCLNYKFTSNQKERVSRNSRKNWLNSEYRTTITREIKERWRDPEFKNYQSKQKKELWKNPEYRNAITKGCMRKWQDPEYRDAISKGATEQLKRQWRDPEYIAIQSKLTKELWQDPKYRALRIKQLSKIWLVTHPDGAVEHVVNLSEFCRKMGLSSGSLRSVANGKRSHHKGYKASYA